MITDTGNRHEFESGAVRDCGADGHKGRCDLLPLNVVARMFGDDEIFSCIYKFQVTDDATYLFECITYFIFRAMIITREDAMLELAHHFEEGCEKYGERNWEKGIPTHCFIDSAIRHYLKCLRGDTDERHDRAFMWNIICCIWTVENKPEYDDYRKSGDVVE